MNKCFVYIFSLCLLCAAQAANAQFAENYRGEPYREQTYTDVQGTPYLADNWADGTVTFTSGKTAAAKLKFNAYNNELLFEGKSEAEPMTFVEPVKGFTLSQASIEGTDMPIVTFGSQYPAVDNQTAASFYQVIADGKVKLLKYYKNMIRTDQAFNSATKTQTFELITIYYLLSNNQMVKIKPAQKTILAALNDKAPQVQAYIKSNAVNFKSDASLGKLIAYYNSL